MKAYLITTGIIFCLIAVAHFCRAIAEHSLLRTRPVEYLSMAARGILAAALSAWAWYLLGLQLRK